MAGSASSWKPAARCVLWRHRPLLAHSTQTRSRVFVQIFVNDRIKAVNGIKVKNYNDCQIKYGRDNEQL